jgi:hypothetical protein
LKLQLQNTRGDIDPRRYLSPYLNSNSIYKQTIPEEPKPWRLQTPFLNNYGSNHRIDPDYYYDYDEDFNIDYTDRNTFYRRSNMGQKIKERKYQKRRKLYQGKGQFQK